MSSYSHARWLFLRLLGLVYFCAFVSLIPQIVGLVGRNGIMPAGASDAALRGVCIGGALLSVVLMAGCVPLLVLPLLWAAYLWLSIACGVFLGYQWDALLLETGLLAVLVAPATWRDHWRDRIEPPRPAVWLMWWLLFRLMFGSGAVKLASGDPTWRNLTALTFHYETQPIPNPIAYYAHQLPIAFNKASTAMTLAIELGAPLLILGPRRARLAATALLAGLQVVIAMTGNYAFFNPLAIALCVWLIDDASWQAVASGSSTLLRTILSPSKDRFSPTYREGRNITEGPPEGGHHVRRMLSIAAAILIVPISLLHLTTSLGWLPPGWQFAAVAAEIIAPLRSVNSYGLFAVMTTTRPEIIVEGSDDGATWAAYEFKYKPGDLERRPPFVAPHQPRLDWQMWFAALGTYEENVWFQNFCLRLLEGSPDVLGLLARDPFEGRPPRYLRARLFRYRFSALGEAAWWTREPLGDYSPVLTLSNR